VNIHGAHSYWNQGALGAADSGVRCVYGLELGHSVNIHGAHSYRKQGALGAAGRVARMGWSWTAACGAYRGGLPPTACYMQ